MLTCMFHQAKVVGLDPIILGYESIGSMPSNPRLSTGVSDGVNDSIPTSSRSDSTFSTILFESVVLSYLSASSLSSEDRGSMSGASSGCSGEGSLCGIRTWLTRRWTWSENCKTGAIRWRLRFSLRLMFSGTACVWNIKCGDADESGGSRGVEEDTGVFSGRCGNCRDSSCGAESFNRRRLEGRGGSV